MKEKGIKVLDEKLLKYVFPFKKMGTGSVKYY